MPPSGPVGAVIESFRPEFTEPTWNKVLVVLRGTILARGRRTGTATLRPIGLGDVSDFSKYDQVFHWDVWSSLRLARRLTGLLVSTFGLANLPLSLVIGETLERRWGRRIRVREQDRDSLVSSNERAVSTSGIRWIALALVVTPATSDTSRCAARSKLDSQPGSTES